jgi:hypothetical protein
LPVSPGRWLISPRWYRLAARAPFRTAGSGRPLVADLDQVRFIGSAGLGALPAR